MDFPFDAWHGKFGEWRVMLASALQIPLYFMEGIYDPAGRNMTLARYVYNKDREALGIVDLVDTYCPIPWSVLQPNPLHAIFILPNRDGRIAPEQCARLADKLEAFLPKIPQYSYLGDDWHKMTRQFIAELRASAAEDSPLIFDMALATSKSDGDEPK